MSAVEDNPQRTVNRRSLLKAAAIAVASTPPFYDGFSRVVKVNAYVKEEIAAMPTPGYTQDEVEAAKTEVAQGYEYLGELVQSNSDGSEVTVVDLRAPSFATSEAIVRSQNGYDNKIESIQNHTDNLVGTLEVAGGIVGLAAAAMVTGHALTGRNLHTTTEKVSQ